ncbi:MAG: hypothetical protein IIA59_05985 [Candidatus Marinimicrobia bacterium]|nr:hypothetical protein [Candidatus Neomarinimicrobiota bacterium]
MDKKIFEVDIEARTSGRMVYPLLDNDLAAAVAREHDDYMEYIESLGQTHHKLPLGQGDFGLFEGIVSISAIGLNSYDYDIEQEIQKSPPKYCAMPDDLASGFELPVGFYLAVIEDFSTGHLHIPIEADLDAIRVDEHNMHLDRWHFGPTGVVTEIELFDMANTKIDSMDLLETGSSSLDSALIRIAPRAIRTGAIDFKQIRWLIGDMDLDGTNPADVLQCLQVMLK